MGQQQLLLLVLGIVIVGLAVVVGINAFSENRVKSNVDALTTDALRIASDVQAWALKPAQFGGGADAGLGAVTYTDIGYPASGTGQAAIYTNVNGNFRLDHGPPFETCASEDDGLIYVSSWNEDTRNCVVVAINGTSADDVATTVTFGY